MHVEQKSRLPLNPYDQVRLVDRSLSPSLDRSTLVLRGSAARGEPAPHDYDISSWYDGERLDFSKEPTLIKGVGTFYDSISMPDLQELYRQSLRGAPSPFDIIPIAPRPEIWQGILELRRHFRDTLRYDYPLHLLVEEEVARRTYDDIDTEDYFVRKRQPGGKRTMFRATWILKCMNPQLINIHDYDRFMQQSAVLNDLPIEITDTWHAMYDDIDKADNATWNRTRNQLSNWFNQTLFQRTLAFSRDNLPNEYVDAVEKVLDPTTPQDALIQIYKNIGSVKPDYRSWTLRYGLAASNLPEADLVSIWRSCIGRRCDESIMRHLLLNPAFHIHAVDTRELPNNGKVARALKTRSLKTDSVGI